MMNEYGEIMNKAVRQMTEGLLSTARRIAEVRNSVIKEKEENES